MGKVLLVVGHQQSAQGAQNPDLGISEWEFNSKLVAEIQRALGPDLADALNVDVPHWKKAPLINAKHAKAPYHAVIEWHLNSCDGDPRVNYSLMKYAAGSAKGKHLSTLLIDVMTGLGVKPANWKETDPRGVFPTDRPPAKTDKNAAWWEANGWRYRGGTFLWKTNPTAVLTEPFFISNTAFLKEWSLRIPELAALMAAAVRKYIEACDAQTV